MAPQILRAEQDLPPVPGGNVTHLLRSNPRDLQPDRLIFTSADGSRTVTYGQALAIADQLAYGLRHTLQLQPGDRVAIVALNSTLYTVVLQACFVAGVVPVPLNPALNADELMHPFSDASVKYVFAEPDPTIISTVRAALELAKHPAARKSDTVWLLSDAPLPVSGEAGERDLRSVMGGREQRLETHPIVDAKNTPALIIYSSGTTGRMKGTLLSHHNLNATLLMSDSVPSMHDEKALCFLPMYHGYALLVFGLHGFRTGLPTVVCVKFDLAQVCEAIQLHKVTMLTVVPPIMVLLAKSPVVDQYDLTSLKYIFSGAAPLSGKLADQVRARLPGVKVAQGYALSETSVSLTKSPLLDMVEERPASAGRLLPGCEVRLVELDTGKDVAFTEGQGTDGGTLEGEIWVRGANVFMGYLNNPEATREAFSDGWYRTGDLGYFKDGWIYLTGRSKDLIKVGGRQ